MKLKLLRALRYLAINTLFAFCIYYGFWEEHEGAQNIAVFLGWLTSIMALLMYIAIYNDRSAIAKMLYEKDWQPAIPFWIDATFDLIVTAAFVYNGYYVLSVFYLFSIVAGKDMRDCRQEYTFDMLAGRTK